MCGSKKYRIRTTAIGDYLVTFFHGTGGGGGGWVGGPLDPPLIQCSSIHINVRKMKSTPEANENAHTKYRRAFTDTIFVFNVNIQV